MSSTGANKESQGGTLKHVIDNPETQPQSHLYAENQSHSDTKDGNKGTGSSDHSHSHTNQGNQPTGTTHANEETPGGTMKHVINDPANKPQSHTHTADQTGQGKK